jgi:hypothetical protein
MRKIKHRPMRRVLCEEIKTWAWVAVILAIYMVVVTWA